VHAIALGAFALLLLLFPFHAVSQTRPTLERLEPAHLAALHQQRVEWMKIRRVDPLPGIYQDYRAVLHVHAEDAPHTKGTRREVLAAARLAGVKVVMFTDHRGPKLDTWSGVHEGVLFIPGSEDDHQLRFPSAAGDLKFLSHTEEQPDKPGDGYHGIEIYNRHTDFDRDLDFQAYFKDALAKPSEWKKLTAKLKQYPDEVFAAGTVRLPQLLTRWDQELGERPFTAIAANDAHQNQIYRGVTFDPYEVAFRNLSTHILATELSEPEVRHSLQAGRAYVSHDWLCDPEGFYFWASNNLGVFNMGDSVPLDRGTRLEVRLPVSAHVRLFHDGTVIQESDGSEAKYPITEPGAYRIEATLSADGEQRPWIYSNAIFAAPALGLSIPLVGLDPSVQASRNIPYVEHALPKQQLDLYLPKDKTNFPMLVFIHGGGWTSGDRALYQPLGALFAKAGIGVAIPSYRLMPGSAYPAQIEDAAAAFAWVAKNIAARGGDPDRIYLGGHSAGGHLASLLALDPSHLQRLSVPQSAIHGVVSMSGVYDVDALPLFGGKDVRRAASPIRFVHKNAPPFLVTYCQWDYPFLPYQARQFSAALKQSFVRTHLVYVPGLGHITEVLHMFDPEDITIKSVVRFIETGQP
jgi:acetyl esterase/lipase